MPPSLVTIDVVPRERFSHSLETIDNIYRNTRPPFEVVFVDGRFPADIRKQLDSQAKARGFRVVRTNHYLSPNQARNLGLDGVTSEFVVFIDNDVLVAPGRLDKLIECAEETGADLVGPLYLIGRPEQEIIHMAGGIARIVEENGERHFREEHFFREQRVSAVRDSLRREPTELVEFHCMLEMAEHLGIPDLARQLSQAFQEALTASVSPSLRGPRQESYFVAPASHRLRLSYVLRHLLGRLRRWGRQPR